MSDSSVNSQYNFEFDDFTTFSFNSWEPGANGEGQEDIVAIAWKLADDASSLVLSPEPDTQTLDSLPEQAVVSDVIGEIQSPSCSSVSSSSASCWEFAELTDIPFQANTSVDGIQTECITLYAQTNPDEETQTTYLDTELSLSPPTPSDESNLEERPKRVMKRKRSNDDDDQLEAQTILAFVNNDQSEIETSLLASSNESQPSGKIEVYIRLPGPGTNCPLDLKFNEPVKFIIGQEKTSIDEITNEEKKELFEYEFTSDSVSVGLNI